MLTVTLLLVLVSPPEAAPTPEQAKSLYGEGRYVEAARIFEALWRDDPQPKFLYNAGAAWEAAGEDVGALAGFVGYLAEKTRRRDLGAEDRQAVEARVERLEGRLVPVVVEISPTALRGRVRVAVTRDPGGDRFEVTPRGRDIATAAVEERIYLSPGAWRLQLVVPGEASQYYVHNKEGEDVLVYVPLPAEEAAAPQASLRVTRLEGEVELRVAPALDPWGLEASFVDVLGIEAVVVARMSSPTLRLKLRGGPWRFVISRRRQGIVRSGEVAVVAGEVATVAVGEVGTDVARQVGPAKPRRRALRAIGFGVGGASLAGVGIWIMATGDARFQSGITVWDGDMQGGLTAGGARATDIFVSGGGVTGSGAGLALSGAAMTLARSPRRWAVLIAGAGGLSALGGVVGMYSVYRRIDEVTWDEDLESDRAAAPLEPLGRLRWDAAVSGGVVGFGVGMVAGAVLGMVLPPKIRETGSLRLSARTGSLGHGLVLQARF